MRRIVKTLFFAAACALLATGCGKDDTSIPEGPPEERAELVSFGFYAEDNQEETEDGISGLAEDCLADRIAVFTEVRMPREADRSALVARFTTSNDCEVLVDGIVQTSGVTFNDYTYPVDITVRNTKTNKSTVYAVSVKKNLRVKGFELGAHFEPDGTSDADMSMSVHPLTNEPYIFYMQTNTTTTNKGSVVKWDGSGFVAVGSKEFTAGRMTGRLCVKFAQDGTPYVMYGDYTTSPRSRPTIMEYASGAWTAVGGAGYGEALATGAGNDFIVYGGDKRIISAYQQGAAATVPRRMLNVGYYDGTSWTANSQITLLPQLSGTKNVTYNPRFAVYGNTVYMAVTLNGSGYTVLKYDGAWSALAEGEVFGGNAGAHISELAIATDRQGTVYVAVADNDGTKIRVARYSTASSSWQVIGGGPVMRTSSNYFSLALDETDTPYLLYTDRSVSGYCAKIVTIDSESMEWTEPSILLDGIENDRVWLSSGNDGQLYAAFTTEGSSYYVYHLYKCEMETDEE